MRNKKAIQDLSTKKIDFTLENECYRVLSFNPASMTLELKNLDDETRGVRSIAFAHIPKAIKKIIKPN